MSALLTPWGEALDPGNLFPEYPRPQLVRERWLNLNGAWDVAFTPAPGADADDPAWPGAAPAAWDGSILVPFSPETPLSGVGRRLEPHETLWYRRTVELPEDWCRDENEPEELLLHFGAVDQSCVIFVDGVEAGRHTGGFTPFAVTVPRAAAEAGRFELIVAVRDVSDTSHHSRGKQRLRSGGIWYSAQSGIWQSVWLEPVPVAGVRWLTLTPRLDVWPDGALIAAALEVTVHGATDGSPGAPEARTAQVTLSGEGARGVVVRVPLNRPALIPVPEPRLWSPEDPFLYDVEVALGPETVRSYAGLRSFGTAPDEAGTPRLLLNGRPYFAAGLLDQGYWSDGWLTAPSDEALLADVRLAKDLGFTMLRKHIKLEPLRWYHHCDRLGMLVWQDMVNGGRSYRPYIITTPAYLPLRLADTGERGHRRFGRQDEAGREQYGLELRETIEALRNVTSLAAWVPFNEGWGQFDAAETAEAVRGLDPTRVIDHASGWHDQGGGDVRSLHIYFRPFRWRRSYADGRRPVVLSEYGGYSVRVKGHVTTPKRFGYKRFSSLAAFQRAFLELHTWQIAPAIRAGLSATVYTQLSDVEDEDNGLITYDRRVLKADPDAVRAVIGGLGR